MKEMVKIIDNTKKHPEDREYLVCIRAKEGSGESDSWAFVTGRTATYEYIKENIEDIDLNYSFVLVETLPLEKRKSIYAFMKYAGEFYADGFDIEDYIKGDWDEDEYQRNNDIEQVISNPPEGSLKMEDIMDGNVDTTDLN